jgi:hypothetical protein
MSHESDIIQTRKWNHHYWKLETCTLRQNIRVLDTHTSIWQLCVHLLPNFLCFIFSYLLCDVASAMVSAHGGCLLCVPISVPTIQGSWWFNINVILDHYYSRELMVQHQCDVGPLLIMWPVMGYMCQTSQKLSNIRFH